MVGRYRTDLPDIVCPKRNPGNRLFGDRRPPAVAARSNNADAGPAHKARYRHVGGLGLLFQCGSFFAIGSIGDAVFTAPVIIMLLAAPLLGEQVGWIRWVAVGLAFTGTVLAANPVGLSLSSATLLVLVGALFWAYGVILTRQIARQEPSLVQMFFNNCFSWWLPGSAAHLRGVNSVVARCGYWFS